MFPPPLRRPGAGSSSVKEKSTPSRTQHATVPVTRCDPHGRPPGDKPPLVSQERPEREARDPAPLGGVHPKHAEAVTPPEGTENDGVVSRPSPPATGLRGPTGDEEEVEKTGKGPEVEQMSDQVSR